MQYGPTRCMVQAYRGMGKSFIACAYINWGLFLDQSLTNLITSATKLKADENSQFIKQLIMKIPILEGLRPSKDGRSSAISFDVGPADVNQAPSVKSVGIGGQITGSRADRILADDIEIPKNSYTHTLREKLSEQIRELGGSIITPKPDSKIIYLGTPQVEETLYSRLRDRGYEIRIWPSEVPKKVSVYYGSLAPSIYKMIEEGVPAKTPTDPKRFGTLELESRRAEYLEDGYALQFLLDTSPSDRAKHPLKLSDLIVTDLDSMMAHVQYVWGTQTNNRSLSIEDLPAAGYEGDRYYRPAWVSEQMTPYTGSVMYIDPSGQGRDETSYAVVNHLYGQLFLRAVGGFKEGYSDKTLSTLAALALRHKVKQIVCEKNFGDGMFTKLLQPVVAKLFSDNWRCGIEDDHVTGQKELRIIDTLEPVTKSHKLIVDRAVVEDDNQQNQEDPQFSCFWQLTRITRDRGSLKHEDRLEAVAGAVRFWLESMSRDTSQAHDQHLEELRELELKKFIESFSDYGRSAPESDTLWTTI